MKGSHKGVSFFDISSCLRDKYFDIVPMALAWIRFEIPNLLFPEDISNITPLQVSESFLFFFENLIVQHASVVH